MRQASRRQAQPVRTAPRWPRAQRAPMIQGLTCTKIEVPVPARSITLRGVAVHNLKQIDLDIPHRQAGRALRPERQRQDQPGPRHALCRRAAALHRQFFGLHAAVPRAAGKAGRRADRRHSAGHRGDAQEHQPLQPLDRRHHHRDQRLPAAAVCQDRPASFASNAARKFAATRRKPWPTLSTNFPPGTRYLVAFAAEPAAGDQRAAVARLSGRRLRSRRSWAIGWSIWPTSRGPSCTTSRRRAGVLAVVDRLAAGSVSQQRLRDSLETAFAKGRGTRTRLRRRAGRQRLARAGRGDTLRARRRRLAANRLQHASWSATHCGIAYPDARAATVQLQQPAGRLSRVRGFRQHDRHRHGPGRARPGQESSRRGRSPPGTRRPTRTSWKSCSPWPPTIDLPRRRAVRELTDARAAADRRRRARARSSAA